MSDESDKPEQNAWVPSAEQPVPPTTEFQAISPDAVEPIDGAEPDEETAEATTGSAPQADDEPATATDEPAPGPDAVTGSAPQTSSDGPEPISAPASDVESISVPAPEPATAVHDTVTPAATADDADVAARAAADHLPRTGTPDFAVPAPGPATETPAPAAASTEEPPAWKTPAASGLPPQWGDPDAVAAAAETGPQPENGIQNIWGLAPEDRPEVALGAALAGGVLTAILVRTLARR